MLSEVCRRDPTSCDVSYHRLKACQHWVPDDRERSAVFISSRGFFSVELEKQIVFPVLEKARKVAIDLGSYHPLVNMHVPSMA